MTYEEIYQAGYEDGVHDGYCSTLISNGEEERYFGKSFQEQPTSDDKVSLEVYKQVTHERDIAIEQLKELGYELGEKIKTSVAVDCVSRQAVLDILSHYAHNFGADNEIKSLPPVTPTQCIAEIKFSKDDLREICNERIEVECTHGTCKDCKHWKDSDGVYRRGIEAESKCPINNSRVFEGTFCCADFEKRGSSDG